MDKSPLSPSKAFVRLITWATLMLVMLIPAAPLGAQSLATIRPNPAALGLTVGQVQTVEIVLENAQQVYGIDVRASFDPAQVEIIDADPAREGTQLITGSFPAPDFVALNTADNAAGTLRYVVTQVNPTLPATGSGVVFSFQVRALHAGQSTLALTLVEMSDRNGMLLAITPASATIDVAGSGPAAPTGIILQTAESVGSAPPTAPSLPVTPTLENASLPGSTATSVTQETTVTRPAGTTQPPVATQVSPLPAGDAPVGGEPAAATASTDAPTNITEPPAETSSTPSGEPIRMTVAEEVAAGPTAVVAPPTEPLQRAVIGENATGSSTAEESATTSVAAANRTVQPVIVILIIALAIMAAAAVLWMRRR